ncbi:MAG: hypothetical protein AAF675_16105 [Pseudomonadota bacterium]
MNRFDARLGDILEPVRDIAVAELLETMAKMLDDGHSVTAEPKCRSAEGAVVRSGPLSLPRRRDLMVGSGRHALAREVSVAGHLGFEPITIVEPDGFVCVIAPFAWNAMDLLVEAPAVAWSAAEMLEEDNQGAAATLKSPAAEASGEEKHPPPAAQPYPVAEEVPEESDTNGADRGHTAREPAWLPLRRWYLEWFQSRFSDEAPDLEGALHALEGPVEDPAGWRFTIDLGSAPVEALSDLVLALSATGAARVRIGNAGY